MKTSTKLLLLAGAAGLLVACASSTKTPPPETVGSLDLKRYQGTWYEQARLPMFFQRSCVQSEAHYHLLDDGNVAVLNRCLTKSGDWDHATGVASPMKPGVTDRLEVRFDTWFSGVFPNIAKGPYWVFYIDPEYHNAVVGSPDRKYLWFLSRSAEITQQQRDTFLGIAKAKGFDTSRLVWRGQPSN